jgi:hypothetical protein
MLEHFPYILFRPHKRESHDVGVLDNEFQSLNVIRRQRRHSQVRARDVNPLLRPKFLSFRPRVNDFHVDFIWTNGRDYAADASIVEPDGLIRADTVKEFR